MYESLNLTNVPFTLDGHDYTFTTKAEGDVIRVFDSNCNLIADAEFDHGVEQIYYSLVTPENGAEVEGDLDFFAFYRKPRKELAKYLAFLHGESL